MGDLISRSALLNIISKMDFDFGNDTDDTETIIEMVSEVINDIPTAYVIDNVIREIDDDIAYIEADDTKEKFVHYESVASAIRKGGLEYE